MKNDLTEILRQLIGRKINSIYNAQYFYDGKIRPEDLGDLEIKTNSSITVCFTLKSDGESVGAYMGNLSIPTSFEVGDGQIASWERRAVDRKELFQNARITEIHKETLVYLSLEHQIISGLKITLSNGNYFVYFNNGDESAICFNEIPAFTEEGATRLWNPV